MQTFDIIHSNSDNAIIQGRVKAINSIIKQVNDRIVNGPEIGVCIHTNSSMNAAYMRLKGLNKLTEQFVDGGMFSDEVKKLHVKMTQDYGPFHCS